MEIYAYSAPEIAKHAGHLKIGETNRNVEQRVKQQGHELNVNLEIVWQDAVITERIGIDKMLHRFLVKQGFQIQQFDETGRDTEWVECTVADIKKTFAVIKEQIYQDEKERQEIGNKFYLELRNWYYWASSQLPDPDAALRIIVRLLFCYFLKEKELVPEDLFKESFVKEHLKENEEYRYYNAILRNLFFRCLNTPIKERHDIEHRKLIKNVRPVKEHFDNIPFLNGGLFDEHEDDDVPLNDDYFFSDERTRYLSELDGNYKVAGIIWILSQYKYKLALDDLLDRSEYTQTVDPEFIGKVFECLLACIEANSKDNRRKITGSFYTPREIVDYMVDEALDAYLQNNNVHNDDLLQCKILDPACGSGAFPCAIMNAILQRLALQKKLTQAGRYQAKLKILQQVIYGVDIQPMAVQIAELRLFLSLIHDVVPDKKKDNYGIEPLPNLETKFVCANSLIGLKKKEKNGQNRLELPIVKGTIEQLQDTRSRYFLSSSIQEKKQLRRYDESLRKTLGLAMEEAGALTHDVAEKLVSWNPYIQSRSSSFFDSIWMFGVEKFDIVIGNPPYIQKTPAELAEYPLTNGNNNTYVAFTEQSLRTTKANGIVVLVMSSTWLSGAKFKVFRNHILEKTDLMQLVQLPYDMFRTAYIDTAIVLIRNAEPSGMTQFYKHEIRDKLEKGIHPIFEKFPTAEWKKFGKIFLSIPLLKLGKKFWFAKRNVKLGKIAEVQRGCRPPKPDILSNKQTKKYNLRYFNGQIFRYTIERNEKSVYVCYDELLENKPIEFFQAKKILGRQLISRQFRMNLTLVDEDFAFHKGLYAIYNLDKKFDYHYILGILNSKFFSFMQVNFNASLQRDDFPNFSLSDYKEFPIPVISLAEQKPLINLVQKRLVATSAKSVKLDEQIDALVYQLYGLTEAEIKIIEND